MSTLFDPRHWIVLPNGDGMPRDRLGRCPCGNAAFEVRHGPNAWDVRVSCPACVRLPEGWRPVRRIDMETGRTIR